MTRYSKTVIAVLLAVSTWGTTAAIDGAFDPVEWFGLLGAIATAAGVYLAPNTPPAGEPRDPEMSEQAGHVDITSVATVCLIIIAVVAVLFSFNVLPLN